MNQHDAAHGLVLTRSGRGQVVAEALKLLAAALPAAATAGGEPAQAAIASVLAPLLVRCMRSLALPMQRGRMPLSVICAARLSCPAMRVLTGRSR